ncbi:MAG: hypothetical protein H0V86_04695 [Chloroflexia bacterium]|nr:hypothetical protein [Chloroflexia bacterium]
MESTFVALDLEMTGQDYDRDDIIQVGAVKFNERRILDRWQALVRPGVPVPLRISRLTGIRSRDLQNAPRFDGVRQKLGEFIGHHPLVGHSVGHDIRFLRKKGLPVANPEYDTWELATLLIPSLAAYNLAGVAAALGVSATQAHDAMADAEVSRSVFLALLKKLRELPAELVGEVVELTTGTDWSLYPLFATLHGGSPLTAAQVAMPGSIKAQLLAKGVSEAELTRSLLAPPARVQPLEPVAEPTPLDIEVLGEAFSPRGGLAQTFEGYEERPQQVEMMRAVAGVFNEEGALVVEAGTGTGKSLAYLLPAATWALQNGERVVVSTDTINLQDQLHSKDIPDIRSALGAQGRELKATLVKGRGNYLCLKRWEQYRRSGQFTLDETRFLIKVLLWLPNTLTGDVAELPLTAEERVHWLKVCATQETCTGRRCQFGGAGKQCFLYRARQEAEGSHLIVVNHALMLSDIAAGNTVLPEYEYLVIDEAHTLESTATDQLGFSVDARALGDHLDRVSRSASSDRPEGLASTLPVHLRGSRASNQVHDRVVSLSQRLAESTARVRSRVDDFFLALGPILMGMQGSAAYDQKLRLTNAIRDQQAWDFVMTTWENLKLNLTDLQAALDEANTVFEELEGMNVMEYDELLAELQSIQSSNTELTSAMDAIIARPRQEDVCWLNISARTGGVSLHQAPLHVGPLLREGLYSQKRAVVLTSATLSTDRSFEYVKQRLGLRDPHELLVGSPFDYRSAALLLVASDIPEPNSPGYQKAIEAAIVDLVLAAKGRTLVLFTSHSAVQATLKGIQRPLAENDILVLAHGDGPRHRLLQQFRSNPRTVLLGTRSFWEGVDVVGEALSLLIIAKLPFEVPTDPVFVARSESFEDSFKQYAIPQAILRLKQGFGRLIRSKSDRGVVVALDRRLVTKNYGPTFLRSLPGATFRKGPSRLLPREVERWLDGEAQPQVLPDDPVSVGQRGA